MILAATGHRPQKLGGFGLDVFVRLSDFAKGQIQKINPSVVISGMAIGWDQAIACAAVELKIPLHAYIPFEGQESKWHPQDRARFDILRCQAEKVVIVCDGEYDSWKMQKRNEAMVDACDTLLALWDGSSGGTGNCIKYAKRIRSKPLNIVNCWSDWTEFVRKDDKTTSSMGLDWLD